MESINKTVIVYLVFVLPILFWIYPSFGQNEMRNANLPLQKYRLNVSAVCPNDTNRFRRVTDDLYCQIEIAKKRRHRILPIVGYENASHAHFSSFPVFGAKSLPDSAHVYISQCLKCKSNITGGAVLWIIEINQPRNN